jgi:hypothetical protein
MEGKDRVRCVKECFLMKEEMGGQIANGSPRDGRLITLGVGHVIPLTDRLRMNSS